MLSKLIMRWIQRFWHPLSDGELTNTELTVILRNAGVKSIFISDNTYQIPRLEDIQRFLKINIFKFRQYVPEKFDCDNYSFSLMGMSTNVLSGYAVGIIWVGTGIGREKHALNFFIGNDKQITYIEPQTDKIFKNKRYKPYFVVM